MARKVSTKRELYEKAIGSLSNRRVLAFVFEGSCFPFHFAIIPTHNYLLFDGTGSQTIVIQSQEQDPIPIRELAAKYGGIEYTPIL